MTTEKRLYEPPMARDLSGMGVRGQMGTLGFCADGAIIHESGGCSTGNDADDLDPDACSPNGFLATTANVCEGGSNVAYGCSHGSYV